eukprot:RCo020063
MNATSSSLPSMGLTRGGSGTRLPELPVSRRGRVASVEYPVPGGESTMASQASSAREFLRADHRKRARKARAFKEELLQPLRSYEMSRTNTDVSYLTDDIGHGRSLGGVRVDDPEEGALDVFLPQSLIPAFQKNPDGSAAPMGGWAGAGIDDTDVSTKWFNSVFPKSLPAGRMDAISLDQWLTGMIDRLRKDFKQSQDSREGSPTEPDSEDKLEYIKNCQRLYSVCIHEIIRQTSAHCVERGRLLAKVWMRYVDLLNSLEMLFRVQKDKHAQRERDLKTELETTRLNYLQAVQSLENALKNNISHNKGFQDEYRAFLAKGEAKDKQIADLQQTVQDKLNEIALKQVQLNRLETLEATLPMQIHQLTEQLHEKNAELQRYHAAALMKTHEEVQTEPLHVSDQFIKELLISEGHMLGPDDSPESMAGTRDTDSARLGSGSDASSARSRRRARAGEGDLGGKSANLFSSRLRSALVALTSSRQFQEQNSEGRTAMVRAMSRKIKGMEAWLNSVHGQAFVDSGFDLNSVSSRSTLSTKRSKKSESRRAGRQALRKLMNSAKWKGATTAQERKNLIEELSEEVPEVIVFMSTPKGRSLSSQGFLLSEDSLSDEDSEDGDLDIEVEPPTATSAKRHESKPQLRKSKKASRGRGAPLAKSTSQSGGLKASPGSSPTRKPSVQPAQSSPASPPAVPALRKTSHVPPSPKPAPKANFHWVRTANGYEYVEREEGDESEEGDEDSPGDEKPSEPPSGPPSRLTNPSSRSSRNPPSFRAPLFNIVSSRRKSPAALPHPEEEGDDFDDFRRVESTTTATRKSSEALHRGEERERGMPPHQRSHRGSQPHPSDRRSTMSSSQAGLPTPSAAAPARGSIAPSEAPGAGHGHGPAPRRERPRVSVVSTASRSGGADDESPGSPGSPTWAPSGDSGYDVPWDDDLFSPEAEAEERRKQGLAEVDAPDRAFRPNRARRAPGPSP